jgi:phospholipase/carboxylesterase
MSPTRLTGPELAPESGTVKRIVIFLHGVGADGDDLINLADAMPMPDTFFFSPHAPFAYDMAPFGRQWFSLADRNPQTMLAGIEQAAPILNATIDDLLKRFNLRPSNLALVGFSQGSMMSLYTAPRRAEPLAGVVAISGAMLAGERLHTECQARPPICLIHGAQDQVVPFGAMAQAAEILQANSIPVETHARPMLGHGIDDGAIRNMNEFLQRVFSL